MQQPTDDSALTHQNKIQQVPKGLRFLFHLHPLKIAERSILYSRTFGLGGMAALAFLIQAFTGLLLRFYYEPNPADAYNSVKFIEQGILFGQLIRNVHHWSGILFVLITFLHLVRVFLSQAIYKPRRMNWIIGLGLFVIVILSNFSGYLLPWDQLSFWAVTVATNMLEYVPVIGNWLQQMVRGGTEVNGATLLIFYNFHTGIFPFLILILMIYHFWKVRKAKGVAIPESESQMVTVYAYPNLVKKELVVALVFIALVLILSVLFNAPLLDRANPSYSPNPAKAPWYFMGVQELLLHFHPFFAVVVIPLLFFGGLVYLPYSSLKNVQTGHWFYSEKGKRLAIQSALSAIIITPLVIIVDEYLLQLGSVLANIPKIISEGLIPFLLLITSFLIYIVFMRKKQKAGGYEVIVSIFTLIIVSYIILTITGIWFRGQGMILIWPF